MGFEPHQPLSKVKAVNKFTDRMKSTLKEARSALAKAKDDMVHYYNQHQTPAPLFAPSDKVYLDSEDIQTTRPSKKLSHHQLGPYLIERHIGKYAYQLILLPSMRQLHSVFNVVKLTLAPDDPIPSRCQTPPPPPKLVEGKEEYIVKEVLNSRLFRQKIQYLVKWEGYGVEHNTLEYSDHLNNALDKVAEFYMRHPGAPRQIHTLIFDTIPFCLLSIPPA